MVHNRRLPQMTEPITGAAVGDRQVGKDQLALNCDDRNSAVASVTPMMRTFNQEPAQVEPRSALLTNSMQLMITTSSAKRTSAFQARPLRHKAPQETDGNARARLPPRLAADADAQTISGASNAGQNIIVHG